MIVPIYVDLKSTDVNLLFKQFKYWNNPSDINILLTYNMCNILMHILRRILYKNQVM